MRSMTDFNKSFCSFWQLWHSGSQDSSDQTQKHQKVNFRGQEVKSQGHTASKYVTSQRENLLAHEIGNGRTNGPAKHILPASL